MRQKIYPQLFVFEEKYGPRYFMVESDESEQKMFLKVLKERNAQGWYSWMKDHKPYGKSPSYSKEDINQMPASMEDEKKRLMAEYMKWENADKESSKIRNNWSKIQKAIEENNGSEAQYLIDSFRNGEYEEYSRVPFEYIK